MPNGRAQPGGARKPPSASCLTPIALRSRRPFLHPTFHTLHPSPHTLHPTPCTLHPARYTLHPTRYTLHPAPFTISPFNGVGTCMPNGRAHPGGARNPPAAPCLQEVEFESIRKTLTRGKVCGTMRSMCSADARGLAIKYPSLCPLLQGAGLRVC
jgi:hypothetical protein